MLHRHLLACTVPPCPPSLCLCPTCSCGSRAASQRAPIRSPHTFYQTLSAGSSQGATDWLRISGCTLDPFPGLQSDAQRVATDHLSITLQAPGDADSLYISH